MGEPREGAPAPSRPGLLGRALPPLPRRDLPRLEICDLRSCEAVCCYDGVYLTAEEERAIRALVRAEPEFFAFLPRVFFRQGGDRHSRWRKTETRPWRYRSRPAHFADTRCVFALDDGRCSLQALAAARGEHPWRWKPTACWLHPLRLSAEGVLPPPADPADDPDRAPGYPGYITSTPCGAHREDGRPWPEALSAELAWHRRLGEENACGGGGTG